MIEKSVVKLIRDFLICLLTGLTIAFASSVFAGGPEVGPVVIQPEVVYDTGVYLEADAGYAQVNWLKSLDFSPDTPHVHNGLGGFVVGGNAGYQWRPYFATELGGFYMPVFRLLNDDGGEIVKVKSSFFDVAAKVMLPIPSFEYVSPFLKGGVAFRRFDLIMFGEAVPTGAFATAAFLGAGVQYNFNPYLYFILQWNYLGSRVWHITDGPIIGRVKIPSINLYLGGIAIKFQI